MMSDKDKEKYCVNCKHSTLTLNPLCVDEKSALRTSRVTGKKVHSSCEEQRAYSVHLEFPRCGASGEWYEARDDEDEDVIPEVIRKNPIPVQKILTYLYPKAQDERCDDKEDKDEFENHLSDCSVYHTPVGQAELDEHQQCQLCQNAWDLL